MLMGGGLAVGLATCRGPASAECQEAYRQNRPDADRICSSRPRSGSGNSGTASKYGSERGGFGGIAHAAAGS